MPLLSLFHFLCLVFVLPMLLLLLFVCCIPLFTPFFTSTQLSCHFLKSIISITPSSASLHCFLLLHYCSFNFALLLHCMHSLKVHYLSRFPAPVLHRFLHSIFISSPLILDLEIQIDSILLTNKTRLSSSYFFFIFFIFLRYRITIAKGIFKG